MAKKIKLNSLEIKQLTEMNVLTKLRFAVISIFILSTLSLVLVFISEFIISVILILISYFMLFILMIKLLLIKKL
jgi:sterol desaturase/sphingolipid hydroxylase (fatty acid hydroxylase superfamily)